MSLPPKVCPECEEEYVPSVEICVHCDVALVHPDALPDRSAAAMPPVSELTPVRLASAGWAVALSERLVEARIPHRVEPVEEGPSSGRRGRDAGPFGVFVRPEDHERAVAEDRQIISDQIPDLPEGYDPSQAPDTEEGCPACGADVAPDAPECPDCGIALAVPE